MKDITTLCVMLAAMNLLLAESCLGDSSFRMTLARDAIYTPGEMALELDLINKIKIAGEYRFRVHVYVAGVLVRKQVLTATGTETQHFGLTFPPMQSKADVRCRAELVINGELIEARELPSTLFPASEPYRVRSRGKAIWVFDTSGRLQKRLNLLEVEAVDATFQLARSFGTPEIVFIGEDLDPNSMQVICERLATVRNKPVTVFLSQKRLPKDSRMEIAEGDGRSQNVETDFGGRLLRGLGARDLMSLVEKATCVRIERKHGRSVDSHVTKLPHDDKHLCSYLFMLEENERTIIHCQFGVGDVEDPRTNILLRNLLEFADEISDSREERD